jgi:hypothetical protein
LLDNAVMAFDGRVVQRREICGTAIERARVQPEVVALLLMGSGVVADKFMKDLDVSPAPRTARCRRRRPGLSNAPLFRTSA